VLIARARAESGYSSATEGYDQIELSRRTRRLDDGSPLGGSGHLWNDHDAQCNLPSLG
jgi:hypothetical protein